MIRVLAFLFTFHVTAAASGVKILWETRNGTVSTAALVGTMTASEFRQEAMRRLADGQIRIGTFTAYPSEQDWLKGKGYGGTDCMYENWRAELDRRRLTVRPLHCPAVWQAIKIGGAILVRQIDAECNIAQEVVQGGSDPLRVTLSGSQYRLLDVFIQPITEEQLAKKDMFSPVGVFARTDCEITTKRARELLEYLRRLSAAPDITVVLRGDQWFVTACAFPVLFLFDGIPSRIPSKAEVLNAKEAVCGVSKQWPVRCY